MPKFALQLGEKRYEAEIDDLTSLGIGTARTVKRETGMDIVQWATGFSQIGNPDVLAALLYLFQSQAGEPVDWDAINQVKVEDFVKGFSIIPDPDTSPEDSPGTDMNSAEPTSNTIAESAPATP